MPCDVVECGITCWGKYIINNIVYYGLEVPLMALGSLVRGLWVFWLLSCVRLGRRVFGLLLVLLVLGLRSLPVVLRLT